jgi:photosystem II stability/assembly factor-like uncharacterized protein
VDSFAFDPVNPAIIYAGSSGLFRSTDNGETWSLVFPKPSMGIKEVMTGDEADHCFISKDNWPGGKIQGILVDPADSDHLFIAVSIKGILRIFYSQNYGEDWTEIHSVKGSKLHKLYLYPSYPSHERRLFIFTETETSAVTIDSLNHEQLELPLQTKRIINAACGVNPESGDPLFYITVLQQQEDGRESICLWKSDNSGKSWAELRIQVEGDVHAFDPGLSREYSMLTVPEIDGRCIYMGVGGIFWTDTGGYQEYSEGSGSGSMISWYGVMKSLDGGNTWKWVLKQNYDSSAVNLEEGWAERDYDYSWYLVGPKGMGPVGLSTSPVNPKICCYTDLSSTFLTTDGGETWKQLYSNNHPDGSVSTRGMDVTTCYGVHFDPFDRNHIVISYTDIGMFHSKDGGASWLHALKNVPVEWGNTCYWVVFDPEVKGRAWSAWGGAHDLPRAKMFKSNKFNLSKGGVTRSEDGIGTWQKSNQGMPGNSVTTHIVLDPTSPPGKRTLYAAVFDKGVYKSTDDGYTWALMDNGISGNRNAWRLALLPDGTLYLLVARGLRDGKVVDGALYKSTDGAEYWERVKLPTGVNAPNDLEYDPTEPGKLYLACWPDEEASPERYGGLYTTENGGESWRNIFDHDVYAYSITVDPKNPSILYLVTFNSAAYRSEDKGETWARLNGFTFKWGHRAIPDPWKNDMLYITTFGSSVWYGPALGDDEAFEDIYPYK